MTSKVNLLFYSNNCQMCKSLLHILRNENLIQYFKGICVDDSMVRQKLPPGINRVPTIIIPSINKILVADDIFVWLRSIKMDKIQHSTAHINDGNHLTSTRNNPTHKHTNEPENRKLSDLNHRTDDKVKTNIEQINAPIGFVSHEMSGLSDKYAYTTTDEVPRHTYVSYNELDKNTIFTAPEKQAKINHSLQPNYIKDIERKRREQDDSINQIYKQHHQNIDVITMKYRETDNKIEQIVENQQKKIMDYLN